ncbi:hypothetical protein ABIA35_005442 [Catenulispora sp. MAP12-49]
MSVPTAGPPSVSTGIMRHRLLTGLAVAPLTLVAPIVAVAPAEGLATTGRPALPATVMEPEKQAADSVGLLAGGMVVAASAAFAGTAMVRRKARR